MRSEVLFPSQSFVTDAGEECMVYMESPRGWFVLTAYQPDLRRSGAIFSSRMTCETKDKVNFRLELFGSDNPHTEQLLLPGRWCRCWAWFSESEIPVEVNKMCCPVCDLKIFVSEGKLFQRSWRNKTLYTICFGGQQEKQQATWRYSPFLWPYTTCYSFYLLDFDSGFHCTLPKFISRYLYISTGILVSTWIRRSMTSRKCKSPWAYNRTTFAINGRAFGWHSARRPSPVAAHGRPWVTIAMDPVVSLVVDTVVS